MRNDNMSELRQTLEQNPTRLLDKRLQAELQKEEPDRETVLAILEVLKAREADLPVEVDAAAEQAWQQYLSRTGQSEKPPKKKQRWILRAACITLALGVLLVSLSGEVNAKELWERMVRWTDSIIEFFGPGSETVEPAGYEFRTEHPGLQQVYDAVTDIGVTQPVVPMWLPEGYVLTSCEQTGTLKNSMVVADFFNGSSWIIYNVDVYSDDMLNQYQKDNTRMKTVEMGNTTHYIVKNGDTWVVIWAVENIECSITINCQEDELYQVLRSIYTMEAE